MHDEAIEILLTLHRLAHHWNIPDVPKAYASSFEKIDQFVSKWMPERTLGYAVHDPCANPNCRICGCALSNPPNKRLTGDG